MRAPPVVLSLALALVVVGIAAAPAPRSSGCPQSRSRATHHRSCQHRECSRDDPSSRNVSHSTTASTVTATYTFATMNSTCGPMARTDRSFSNTGGCTDYNGAYVYALLMWVTATNYADLVGLYAGRFVDRVPVNASGSAASQVSVVKVTSGDTSPIPQRTFAAAMPDDTGSDGVHPHRFDGGLSVQHHRQPAREAQSVRCPAGRTVHHARHLVHQRSDGALELRRFAAADRDRRTGAWDVPGLPAIQHFVWAQYRALPSACIADTTKCIPGLLTISERY
jgi:hypothetical protein